MINPTVREVKSKINVKIFTDKADYEQLRTDINRWATEHGINIFWITCFLNSQDGEQGAYVYFEDMVDAMAFKLAWV